MKVLDGSFQGPASVTHIGDTAYSVSGMINYMFDPKLKDQDPGPFIMKGRADRRIEMRAFAGLAGVALLLAAMPTTAATPSVEQEIEALTVRVKKLEGARAVKKLQRAFGFYVDRGLWDEAADLFADNGRSRSACWTASMSARRASRIT